VSPGRLAGERDQQLVSDGVAEAVVDELEPVDVEEQHRAAGGGVAVGALEDLVDAVDEQRAVGQSGEGVVQRVMLQAQLRGPAVGDVRQRSGHAGRRAVDASDRQAPGHHPAPAAVGMSHSVLGLHVGRAPLQVGLDRRPQSQHVIRVHELKPDGRTVGDIGIDAPCPPHDRVPAR
jgi:hypothetical protein